MVVICRPPNGRAWLGHEDKERVAAEMGTCPVCLSAGLGDRNLMELTLRPWKHESLCSRQQDLIVGGLCSSFISVAETNTLTKSIIREKTVFGL